MSRRHPYLRHVLEALESRIAPATLCVPTFGDSYPISLHLDAAGANTSEEISTGSGSLSLSSTNTATEGVSHSEYALSGNGSEALIAEDERIQVLVTGVTAVEGRSGTQGATFVVSLSRASSEPVLVSYQTLDHTATSGDDYGAVNGILEFAPGETSKEVVVSIFGDPIQERSEAFYFDVAAVSTDLVIPVPRVIGSILNDDAIPTVSVQDLAVFEGEGTSPYVPSSKTVALTLSNASLDPVTVTLASLDEGIDPATDYTPFSKTITFAPGQTSVTHTIVIANDLSQEPTEIFHLGLSSPTGATLGDASATLTITDDDTWTVVGDPLMVVEGNDGARNVFMTLRLVNPFGIANHEHPIQVIIAPSFAGTAWNKSDFDFYPHSFPRVVVFAPGELEATFSVLILGDVLTEQNETLQVQFGPTVGAQSGPNAILTILNDDMGDVLITPASLDEGDAGEKVMNFNVNLSLPMAVPVSVSYHSFGVTALEGVDFAPLAGELIFAPGEQQKTISIPIYGDSVGEDDEVFTVQLTSVAGVISATGTITNDDPVVGIQDTVIDEGEPVGQGITKVYVPIRLSPAMENPVSVDFRTVDGTAVAGSDYVERTGTILFAPGQTLQFIELEVISDLILESDEAFFLELSGVEGADIMNGSAVVTIRSDETALTVESVEVLEGNSGTRSLIFNVTLSRERDSAVTVNYTTSDFSAQADSDYAALTGVLTFAPGETVKQIAVSVFGDIAPEADETFNLVLSGAVGASLPGMTGSTAFPATILNDDAVVSIAARDASVLEGDEGMKALIFDVSLSHALSSSVSVSFATADGSAHAGVDYAAISGTLYFAPGQTLATIEVPIFGDLTLENSESFGLRLFDATGVSIVSGSGGVAAIGTIATDDSFAAHLQLTISKGGRKASWVDGDGDYVSVSSNRPIFSTGAFDFGLDRDGSTVSLHRLRVNTNSGGTPSILFAVDRMGTGDGLVNVGGIDASGQDLENVRIPGTLGSIQAGDDAIHSRAVATLSVNAFGLSPSSAADTTPLRSELVGSIGRFKVIGDVFGAELEISHGSMGRLKVGGDILSSSGAPTSIIVDGRVSKISVGGDVRGIDSTNPLLIEIASGEAKMTAAALGSLQIGGDVVNTAIFVEGSALQRGVQVGTVLVNGDWNASNLMVGAHAGGDGWAGTEDDVALQTSVSRIARIRIEGSVSGTSSTENPDDHFGIVAGRIAKFQLDGHAFDLSKKQVDVRQLSDDLVLREVAG